MEVINNNNYELEQYKKASKKVKEIKGFYAHLIPYIIVNLVIIFINLKYTPNNLWFFWPLLGWGISVIIHGIVTFDMIPFLNKNWETKKIQQFIEEEQNKQNKYE